MIRNFYCGVTIFYAFFGLCERCSLAKEAMKTLTVSAS